MRRGRMQNSGKSAHFMLHFAHKNLARLSRTINPTIYLFWCSVLSSAPGFWNDEELIALQLRTGKFFPLKSSCLHYRLSW